MKKAHQQDFGKNVCIYSCKKKSKYSAVKRTLCREKKILGMLSLETNNTNVVNLSVNM